MVHPDVRWSVAYGGDVKAGIREDGGFEDGGFVYLFKSGPTIQTNKLTELY